jgi:hypothetical protein
MIERNAGLPPEGFDMLDLREAKALLDELVARKLCSQFRCSPPERSRSSTAITSPAAGAFQPLPSTDLDRWVERVAQRFRSCSRCLRS